MSFDVMMMMVVSDFNRPKRFAGFS
jgi:hypothetical protein